MGSTFARRIGVRSDHHPAHRGGQHQPSREISGADRSPCAHLEQTASGGGCFDAFTDHQFLGELVEAHRATPRRTESRALRLRIRFAAPVAEQERPVRCGWCAGHVLHQRDHSGQRTAAGMAAIPTEPQRGGRFGQAGQRAANQVGINDGPGCRGAAAP